MTDDHTRLLHALMTAGVDLNELPHPRHAGRLLLAVAVEGKDCSDAAVARIASMLVAIARDVLPFTNHKAQRSPSHAAIEDLSAGLAELSSLGFHAGRNLRFVRNSVGTERLSIAVAGMLGFGAKGSLVAAQSRFRQTRARQDRGRAQDGKGGLHP